MKKILAFVLTLMFTLTAVGAFAEAPAEEKEPSKTLVVYFSATGSTERIANMIAEATGADVFVIDPRSRTPTTTSTGRTVTAAFPTSMTIPKRRMKWR